MEIWIIAGAIAAVLYVLYVKAINIKNKALEAASSIDVQLQKRRDLVPNILTLAKKFMEHEKDLLSELTALRSQLDRPGGGASDLKADMELDGNVGGILGHFFAVAENYPELKSQSTIIRAQEAYEEVEGHIAAARRFYNSAITDLNNALETFPLSIFTKLVGAQKMPYFAASNDAAKPVNAADYL